MHYSCFLILNATEALGWNRRGSWSRVLCVFNVWRHVLRVGGKWRNRRSQRKWRPRDWLSVKKQLDEIKPTQTCIPSSTYDLLQTWITTISHHYIAFLHLIITTTLSVITVDHQLCKAHHLVITHNHLQGTAHHLVIKLNHIICGLQSAYKQGNPSFHFHAI